MNTPRTLCFGLLTLTALAALPGCNSPTPTSFNPAGETEKVGKLHWVSEPDAIAILETNHKPFSVGTVLVALDQNGDPTGFLVTTKDSVVTKNPVETFQGVKIMDGNMAADAQVARPGPEFKVLGQIAVNVYKTKVEQSAAPETGTPTGIATVAKTTAASPST